MIKTADANVIRLMLFEMSTQMLFEMLDTNVIRTSFRFDIIESRK